MLPSSRQWTELGGKGLLLTGLVGTGLVGTRQVGTGANLYRASWYRASWYRASWYGASWYRASWYRASRYRVWLVQPTSPVPQLGIVDRPFLFFNLFLFCAALHWLTPKVTAHRHNIQDNYFMCFM